MILLIGIVVLGLLINAAFLLGMWLIGKVGW